MESGNPVNYASFLQDQTSFNKATAALGCSSAIDMLQCLRGLSFESINGFLNGTGSSLSWNAVIDNDFIAGKTSLQLAQGQFVHVPIISGANEEGTQFSPSPVGTEQEFINILESIPFLPLLSVPANKPKPIHPQSPSPLHLSPKF
jgi:hypothetical protein